MQSSLFPVNLYINDFHWSNSMAAQREAAFMSLHPYSREQALMQVASLHRKAVSKENANVQSRRHQTTGVPEGHSMELEHQGEEKTTLKLVHTGNYF